MSNLSYSFSIEKSDTYPLNCTIKPSRSQIYYYNEVLSPSLDNTLRRILLPHIKKSKWLASWDGAWDGFNGWKSKWVSGELPNKHTITIDPLKVSGNDSRYTDGFNFKVKLSDGGYFVYNQKKENSLIFSNGDSYTGSFTKVPFSFKKRSISTDKKSLFEKGDLIMGSEPNGNYASIEVFFNLNSMATSDFALGEGVYTHSSGEIERIKDGDFIDRRTPKSVDGTTLPTFKGIVGNAVNLRDKGEEERYEALCKQDFWSYIGKYSLNDLDKELFKKTEEYASLYKEYNNVLQNGTFYTITGFHFSDYTPTSARYWRSRTWDNSNPFSDPIFSVMHIYDRLGIPVTKTCQRAKDSKFSDNPGVLLTVPSNDLDFLKTLENYDESGELGILVIFKAGVEVEFNEYGSKGYIVKPIGMYLINDKTNTILYDFTSCLDKGSLGKHINDSKQVVRKAKSNSHSSTYHSTPKKEHCYECGGDGIVEGANLYGVPGQSRARCRGCNGKGYTLTHYY